MAKKPIEGPAKGIKIADDDRNRWRAVAMHELHSALELQERAATLEPHAALMAARLLAEPHAAGASVATLCELSIERAAAALRVLGSPVPTNAADARTLSRAAWGRTGDSADLMWAVGYQPGELFAANPFLFTLAGEGIEPATRFREPRLFEDLDARGAGLRPQVQAGGVYDPVQAQLVTIGKVRRLEVVAGSRRTRAARCAWREGLRLIAAMQPAVCPPPLPALLISPERAASVFVADNLTAATETPWTIVERFAQAVTEGGMRIPQIAEDSGLSERTVTYYLALATLSPVLRAEGAAGRLGIKLGSFLAQAPDFRVQELLYSLTAKISPEARRIDAARDLLERHGPKGLESMPVLEPAVRPKPIPLAQAAARMLHGDPKSSEVKLLQDYHAALGGDAAALRKLPLAVQTALNGGEAPPAAAPVKGKRRAKRGAR